MRLYDGGSSSMHGKVVAHSSSRAGGTPIQPKERHTLTATTPKPATQHPVRCIQRPTGEWFTFVPGNPPGKDTPDASDLCTEAEARTKLGDLGYPPPIIDQSIAYARKHAEVSGDTPDWNAPVPSAPA
jgi:hypothetical protein